MSYYLFLDDSRKPHQVTWKPLPENVEWVHVRSYEEFVHVIRQMGIPKFVTYDCDLCQEHYDCYFSHREGYVTQFQHFRTKCGIDCILHLIKLCKKKGVKHPAYILHTKNNYAEGYMQMLIEDFNKAMTWVRLHQYTSAIKSGRASSTCALSAAGSLKSVNCTTITMEYGMALVLTLKCA